MYDDDQDNDDWTEASHPRQLGTIKDRVVFYLYAAGAVVLLLLLLSAAAHDSALAHFLFAF
jgi:hypothetical protein